MGSTALSSTKLQWEWKQDRAKMLAEPIQVCRPSVTWWKVGAGEQKSLGWSMT